jgi:hypothetical protein
VSRPPKYARKTDGNHEQIRDGLREFLGDDKAVIDTSKHGWGILDTIVKINNHGWWFEIKMPGEDLTPKEAEFISLFRDSCRVVYTLEQAIEEVQKIRVLMDHLPLGA